MRPAHEHTEPLSVHCARCKAPPGSGCSILKRRGRVRPLKGFCDARVKAALAVRRFKLSRLDAERILRGWCVCGHEPDQHLDEACVFWCECGPVGAELRRAAAALVGAKPYVPIKLLVLPVLVDARKLVKVDAI